MNAKEKAVRDAAAQLSHALVDARKAGLLVTWTGTPDGLQTLAISETAKSQADAKVTVVADGVQPGSPAHAKAQKAAEKAVEGTVKM